MQSVKLAEKVRNRHSDLRRLELIFDGFLGTTHEARLQQYNVAFSSSFSTWNIKLAQDLRHPRKDQQKIHQNFFFNKFNQRFIIFSTLN